MLFSLCYTATEEHIHEGEEYREDESREKSIEVKSWNDPGNQEYHEDIDK